MSGHHSLHTRKTAPGAAPVGQVQRVALTGLLVNSALSGVKFLTGIFGASHALIADAAHSLSDVSTDLAVLFGVKFWVKPADDDHPYGHRRIETLITAVIGGVLLLVAARIGFAAVVTIQDPHIPQPSVVALVVALLSIISKEALYRWTFAAGRRMKSPATMANAWHHRSDALSSVLVAVAISVALTNPRWSFVDRFGAAIVSLFILRAGWKIMRGALGELIDTGACEKDRETIRALVLTNPAVRGVHAIRTRRMGSGLSVDLHIHVAADMTVKKGHDISEEVKQALIERGPDVIDVVVHLEPFQVDHR